MGERDRVVRLAWLPVALLLDCSAQPCPAVAAAVGFVYRARHAQPVALDPPWFVCLFVCVVLDTVRRKVDKCFKHE